MINGIILISWRQTILQRQIDHGARLGHVVLSLAKMELENFFKNVMPVADYFDHSNMLLAVSEVLAVAVVIALDRPSLGHIAQTVCSLQKNCPNILEAKQF